MWNTFFPQSNRKVSLSNSKVIKVSNSKVSKVISECLKQFPRLQPLMEAHQPSHNNEYRYFRGASVVTKTSYDRYLLAEWIHRLGENTSDIRVGTMRTVTACYRLVARRILTRQVPVAQHFKVVVPGIREDD